MPIIGLGSLASPTAGNAKEAPAPVVTLRNSRRLRSDCCTDPSFPGSGDYDARLDSMAQILAERKAAVLVELLMAGPAHRIAHTLYFKVRANLQALKLRTSRQHELCLPDLAGQRVARIETSA